MTNQVRLAGLLGFLLGMPVLAIPAVNGGIERWWYGPEEALAHVEAPGEAGSRAEESHEAPGRDSARDLARGSSMGEREIDERRDEESGRELQFTRDALPPPPLSRLPDPDPPADDSLADAKNRATAEFSPHRSAPRSADPFADLQQRLRAFGCTMWRIEATPEDDELVRFTCQVPLPGHDSYQRTFTTEAREPLEAMTQAIGQIEQWRKAHNERPAGAVEATNGKDSGRDRVRMIRRSPATPPTK